MYYLVTTSHALLLVNSKKGSYREIHSGVGLYYGISQDHSRIFVAARGQLNSSGTPPQNERGCILIFDQSLRLAETWESPFPLRDMHQILWWRERLWITCSFDNMIAITNGGEWREWYPFGISDTEPLDRNHFNSLTPSRDELIIIATNRGASDMLHFDAATLTLRSQSSIGTHAHNAWRQGDEWLTCSSGEGRIIGTKGFSLTCGRFPRGVAITKHEIAVGLSEPAERRERDLTDGAINFYTRMWKHFGTIDLPQSGLVLDIQAVDSKWLNEAALH